MYEAMQKGRPFQPKRAPLNPGFAGLSLESIFNWILFLFPSSIFHRIFPNFSLPLPFVIYFIMNHLHFSSRRAPLSIVLVGAGNVATQLGCALQRAGFRMAQVYSRTERSAARLSSRLRAPYTVDVRRIVPDAELYVFSVADSAILPLLQQMPSVEGLCVHTAGSVPADVFRGYSDRYGVLYPLQTFCRERDVAFDRIPVLYEANGEADERLLQRVAEKLSSTSLRMDSAKRKEVHLAAVFACNFANYMYSLATEIMEEAGVGRELLFPLIEETASKIRSLHPLAAQTGPAVRGDRATVDGHLSLLRGADQRKIYEALSSGIMAQASASLSSGERSASIQ